MTPVQLCFRQSAVCYKLAKAMLRETGESTSDLFLIGVCCNCLAMLDDDIIIEIIRRCAPVMPRKCEKLLAGIDRARAATVPPTARNGGECFYTTGDANQAPVLSYGLTEE